MKKGRLKKWLWGMLIVFTICLMFGCTDVSTDTPATTEATVDTQPPTISAKELSVEYGGVLNYSDIASVSDDSEDEIKVSVVDPGIDGIFINEDNNTISLNSVGRFEITVSAEDESGNKSETKVMITVEDHVQPILSLSQTEFSLTAGDAAPNYVSVARASDNADGDLTGKISVDSSKVNSNSAGTYEVTYTVSDSSGNVTIRTATVTVIAKTQPASTNETASNNASSGNSDSQVMITRTGECYHTHKCGNGTYFWVSFSEAQSRGLRPCQKCY